MFVRCSCWLKSLTLLLIAFTIFSITGYAQDNNEKKPQTQPDNSKYLFQPVDFLPVFKKFALPDENIISNEDLCNVLVKVFDELKVSWLKNHMFNELFEMMKTRKHKLFKDFIDNYFKTISSYAWKVDDFEALITQYGKKEGRIIFEQLLSSKFGFDEEFAVRMPFLFFYQKTFTFDDSKKDVIAFLGKLQKTLEKPSPQDVSNYYWLSMLMLASGDESKLAEVQDWLFQAYFDNESTKLLSAMNFKSIIIQALAKNLTQKFADSGSWSFAIEHALERNILPELNAIFSQALIVKDFARKTFAERIKLINANIQPYYALICLLNGEKESIDTVSETVSKLSSLTSIVLLLTPNEYNKQHVPQFLMIMMTKLKSVSYSTRFSAKEAFRRFLLYASEINSATIADIQSTLEDANLSVYENRKLQAVLVFLAASIKDEVLFEKLFVKLQKDTKTRKFFNNIRNQFYRSAEYFNENLKKILGKKLLSIITPDMPFSEYVVFDVLKEFAEIKEIAEEILEKTPEWFTFGKERNRRFFFSYSCIKETFRKISVLFPKKTAQLIIPMYGYLEESEKMNDSTRMAIHDIFLSCGMNCVGYLQQLFELKKDNYFLFLISSIKDREIGGFVYEMLRKSNISEKSEVIVKIIENMRHLIDKDKIALLAPYMQGENRNEFVKLSAFITVLYVLSS